MNKILSKTCCHEEYIHSKLKVVLDDEYSCILV